MRGVNKVTLIGNLGRDPEILHIEGDIPVAKFPLATTETRKDRQGNLISDTEWHSIVLWRGLAELAAKRLKKGGLVYIEGKLKTRNWEDKNGNRRYQTEIIAETLILLDKRKSFDNPDTATKENTEEDIIEYSANAKFDSDNDDALQF